MEGDNNLEKILKKMSISDTIIAIENNYLNFIKEGKKEYLLIDLFDLNLQKWNSVFKNIFIYNIIMNKKMSLNKLIEIIIFIKSSNIFNQDKSFKLEYERLVRQFCMDIKRQTIYINSKKINFNKKVFNSDYKILLYFIKKLSKINLYLDYNLINKVCILCCQNILNLMFEIIQIEIFSYNPNLLIIHNSNIYNQKTKFNYIDIIINKQTKKIIHYFNGFIVNQNLDLKGKLEYTLELDLVNNNYKISYFNLNLFKINYITIVILTILFIIILI